MSEEKLFEYLNEYKKDEVDKILQRVDQLQGIHSKTDGNTVLHEGASIIAAGWNDTIEQLVSKYKKFINQKNQNGDTPLHLALRNSGEGMMMNNIVQILVNANPDLDIQNNQGNTPLHEAVINNHETEILKQLITDSNLKMRNNANKTPMDLAEEHDDIERVTKLNEVIKSRNNMEMMSGMEMSGMEMSGKSTCNRCGRTIRKY